MNATGKTAEQSALTEAQLLTSERTTLEKSCTMIDKATSLQVYLGVLSKTRDTLLEVQHLYSDEAIDNLCEQCDGYLAASAQNAQQVLDFLSTATSFIQITRMTAEQTDKDVLVEVRRPSLGRYIKQAANEVLTKSVKDAEDALSMAALNGGVNRDKVETAAQKGKRAIALLERSGQPDASEASQELRSAVKESSKYQSAVTKHADHVEPQLSLQDVASNLTPSASKDATAIAQACDETLAAVARELPLSLQSVPTSNNTQDHRLKKAAHVASGPSSVQVRDTLNLRKVSSGL
eukprot:Blabericola_migrator_1__3034@NODE_1883_length_3608_cov_126_335781_g1206_i0_p2_GENE_NODE_1883_length_3608_cov_126_335781_g1206_i0NODE_1883_length_3608_cov_126_335781_g1206_i0_p2_ORF_typecomplete_len293_score51_62DUF4449/PF14613_6/1_2e03DUF4449/PF14613_6/0_24HTH_WhiA/PF02650_14/9_9e03HTH_WhiA/PF02650_14/2_3HTH_WhiA/PF02650_14/3_2e03ArnB_C/PF18677_1/24ArnB_C/PF18677_1/16ArnB_C/PF18677_1/1_2e03_NODE_1883_length_3608_cov_126_335781_g1206_i022563134